MQFAEIAKSFVVFSAPKPDFGLLVIFKKPDYLGKSKEKSEPPERSEVRFGVVHLLQVMVI
jgi:hypothetical protein